MNASERTRNTRRETFPLDLGSESSWVSPASLFRAAIEMGSQMQLVDFKNLNREGKGRKGGSRREMDSGRRFSLPSLPSSLLSLSLSQNLTLSALLFKEEESFGISKQ